MNEPFRSYHKQTVLMSATGFKKAVKLRAHGQCEAAIDDVCTGRYQHAHHIKMRSQGGPHDPKNGLGCCTACHDFIHAHPDHAYQRGWLERSNPRPGDFHFVEVAS